QSAPMRHSAWRRRVSSSPHEYGMERSLARALSCAGVVGELAPELDVVDDAHDHRLHRRVLAPDELAPGIALVDHEHAIARARARAVEADARPAGGRAVGAEHAQEEELLALEHGVLHRRDDRAQDLCQEHQVLPMCFPRTTASSTKPMIAASTGTNGRGHASAPSRPSTKCTRSPGPL